MTPPPAFAKGGGGCFQGCFEQKYFRLLREADMKKAVWVLQTLSVVLVVSAMALTGSISSVRANEKLNYKGMVEEIGGIFNEALSLYKKGNAQEAKLKAQSAYLEVFENLEGPIRINVSARKNYELEQEFIAIRKMIVAKEPAAAIEKRINAFM